QVPGHLEPVPLVERQVPRIRRLQIHRYAVPVGRELAFVEMEPEAVRQGMLAAGLPAEVPARLLGSQADYAREAGPTTDTVRRLLGRPARSFQTWAADHAAAFTA
ncbi:hypothetical protein AB0M47_35520, partial [Hamadaea sp. NPDC051192]